MVAFEIPGPPVAFARTRMSNTGARFTPKPQRDYGALIRLKAGEVMDGAAPTGDAVRVSVRAVYVAPASWSKKKRADAVWKTSKPDIDNILKLAKDAMAGIIYRDDAQVVEVVARKTYGEREHLQIDVSLA